MVYSNFPTVPLMSFLWSSTQSKNLTLHLDVLSFCSPLTWKSSSVFLSLMIFANFLRHYQPGVMFPWKEDLTRKITPRYCVMAGQARVGWSWRLWCPVCKAVRSSFQENMVFCHHSQSGCILSFLMIRFLTRISSHSEYIISKAMWHQYVTLSVMLTLIG